jgi:hypothetical protein
VTVQYLYPRQRQIELLAAMYAGGLGIYSGVISSLGITSPFIWLAPDPILQRALTLTLVIAALIHATGVWINGRWWCSPFLRAAGMTTHTAVAAFAVTQGLWSSAAYTYACVTILLLFGVGNASRDCVKAWKGD